MSRGPRLVEQLSRAVVLAFFSVAVACDGPTEKPLATASPALREDSLSREPLKPLPPLAASDPILVGLGRRLFNERRLSKDGSVACSSCHDLANGGDDGRARSVGIDGRTGVVNAPSVFNAGLNFVQFWDGRAKTLEEQVDGPVADPTEMGSSMDEVVSKLSRDAEYQKTFTSVFGDGVNAANLRSAIAAFERTLVTPGAAFDRWLNGDQTALTVSQKTGYELFKGVGCVACHQGRNVGGNMFQRFGVLGDYFNDRGKITQADHGRFNVTGAEADRFVFRVPSLRNVEHTAPYFHDGSAQTLKQAVQTMAKYQLGRALSDEQVSSIVEFLKSLSGKMPETAVALAP